MAYGLWLMAYALYLMPYALTYSIEWAIKKQRTPLQNGICQIDYGLWLMAHDF